MSGSTSLYYFSVVPFTRSIKALQSILDKAEQHAKDNGEDVESYIQLQIHPDMKNFGYQIQRLTDAAKFVLVRVAGKDPEPLSMPDEEKTWAEFKARLAKTVAILDEAKPEEFAGKEGTEINLFGGKYKFNGTTYLQNFAIPNFYFHVTTAYDLLRGKGVPIGKMDYLGVNQ